MPSGLSLNILPEPVAREYSQTYHRLFINLLQSHKNLLIFSVYTYTCKELMLIILFFIIIGRWEAVSAGFLLFIIFLSSVFLSLLLPFSIHTAYNIIKKDFFPMNYEQLISVTGIITSISPFNNDCCSQLVAISTEEQEIHLTMSPDTMVVDSMPLLPGMRIAAFFDSMAPVPLIYPPQYRALLVTTLRAEEDVTLKYFDETLTSSDNTLKLNIFPSTFISTQNGQSYPCPLGEHYLMVYYTNTTRSIPAQTSPTRIIIMCHAASWSTQMPNPFQTPQNFQEPQTSQMPNSFQMPQNFQEPQTSQMPNSFQMPQNFQEPQTSQMPNSFQTPHNFQEPQTSQMSDSLQMPQGNQEPQTSQMSDSLQMPQSNQEPQMAQSLHRCQPSVQFRRSFRQY